MAMKAKAKGVMNAAKDEMDEEKSEKVDNKKEEKAEHKPAMPAPAQPGTPSRRPRTDSAITRAVSGGVLSQPPTWGMGHTMSSVHLASSARERPATASATMRAGFVPSRSGAWSTPRAGTGGSVGAGGGGLPRESGPAYPA